MNVALLELLGLSVTVGLSPFPILAMIPLVSDPDGRARARALALGWSLGLLAAIVVALLLVEGLGAPAGAGDASRTVGWIKLLLGVVLVAVAVKSWMSRPRSDADRADPAWMASLASATVPRIGITGLALAAANPKILVLALGAASAITTAPVTRITGAALFVVIGSLSLLALLVAAAVDGPVTRRALAGAEAFMSRHGSTILAALLGVIGVLLVGDGLDVLR